MGDKSDYDINQITFVGLKSMFSEQTLKLFLNVDKF